ncbi:MAG: MBL fold metallo-hydrolase [Rhizobiaceae bacterium]
MFGVTCSRRKFLSYSFASTAIGLTVPSASSFAAVDFRNTQAPGFFRFALGKFEVTVLTDGLNSKPLRFSASNIPEERLKAYLKKHHLPTDARQTHLNVCLINTGENLVLIDTGSGDNFRETAGLLTASLESAGYAAEDVDTIVITHGHLDHIWGIFDDFVEGPRFPNAKCFINEAERDYWTAADLETRMPEGFKFFATGAHRNLKPVAELTSRIKPGAEIVPGISAISAPGHTLGHMYVVAESNKESLLVVGDAITHPLISLENPDWQPQMDMEKVVAVKTRKRLLDMAAQDRMLVAAYHIPFPGVGHIARLGNSYRWVPLTWQWEL